MKFAEPVLIQGGMGIGVSNWILAKAVAKEGQLGVVSGTALDVLMVRRLQVGDPGGHVRRALAAFPIAEAAESVVEKYFVEGGKADDVRFKRSPTQRHKPSRALEDLLITCNFVEVFLAKEDHDGLVGINYLEKLQAPTLPSIYGAMLAGVDYVLMGAGIPRTIPVLLDKLSEGLPVDLKLDVKGSTREDDFRARFDPVEAMRGNPGPLKRPAFLAIISSHVLATMLSAKLEVPVDGFIVEAPTAGGHNAPPRGKLELSAIGEPIYGERDIPDLAAINALGLPFWLAGGYTEPKHVEEALEQGAAGVQIGTPFAYCEESGFDPVVKREVLELSRAGKVKVFTDPRASPSGFPFKVVPMEGSYSEAEVYESHPRQRCELGYLRTAYRTDAGKIGWRCPAEPIDDYLRHGGAIEDTVGRKCLCSSLMSNLGLTQLQSDGELVPTLVTSGDGVQDVARFLEPGADTYRAVDVIRQILPESLRAAGTSRD